MCQFCHQHGEGKKWYLKAEHYSRELLDDGERRRYITDFIRDIGGGNLAGIERKLQPALRVPAWLRRLCCSFHERRYRRDHFGQVVPVEDLEKVLELSNSIVRMPCLCRRNTTGARDAHYCFGLSIDPGRMPDIRQAFEDTFHPGPDSPLFDRLTKEEALDLHRRFEHEGLVHTIWTFKSPFIGAICNCDRSDCLAMVALRYDFRLFFRAEYVAQTAEESCIGCRACLPLCQFGAIGFSAVRKKAFIDPLKCYGCGICRSACEGEAIRLVPRGNHPFAGDLW